jgi:hypothetical protein
MAYVYRHIRLDKNEPFYIGIGEKEKRAYSIYDRSALWKKIVKKSNYEVEILFYDLTWEKACEKEKEFIKLYGRIDLKNGCLANLTDGGEGATGYKHSKESLLKIGEKSKGRKKSPKQIEKWKSKMNFEKSPEFKEKIRQTLTGKKHTSERKENQRKSHLGKKLTEETKQKLKEYYKHNPQKWKGTKLSDEQKIKLSISHTGKTGILSSNKKSVIKILGNEKIEYFSIADAAKHHNVHPATITKYIKNKTMPKDGASWYYKKDLK